MESEKSESFAGVMLKASSIIFVLIFIQRAFGYLFNSLLSKSISKIDYGSYTFAWSIAMFASGIFLLGVSSATARYVAYYRGKKDIELVNSVIKTGFWINLFLTFISLFGIFVVNRYFPSILSLNPYLLLFVGAIFVIHCIGSFFSAVIGGYRKPEISNIFGTVFPVLSFAFAFIVVLLRYEFVYILFGIALAFLISNILSIVFALKNYGLKGYFKYELIKDLLKFGISMVFIDTANNLLSWADVFIIKMYMDFSNLSVYWAATITANVLLMFSQPIISIFAPIVAELFGKRDTERLAFMSSYLFERVLLLSIPILLVFLMFPKGLLSIIFTQDYMMGALPLQILSISTFLLGLSMLFRILITASGKPHQEARIIFFAAIANVILNLILVKPYGIEGASVATLFSSLFILLLSFKYARKDVKITIYKDRFIKIIASLIIPIILIYIVKILFISLFLEFIASILALGLFYFLSLMFLKTFREEDTMLLTMILGRFNISKNIEKLILDVVKRGIS